jgi:hypothetical protein
VRIDIVGAFNSNYVNSKITKTIYWYLITAFYSNEPFYDQTVGVASSPWSGNYTINPALWGYAHVGQFTKVGWKYLDAASGTFTGGGNYVTMMAPTGGDYSVIAQTSGATAAQNITFKVAGGLSTGNLTVWRSNATAQFQKQPDVTRPMGRSRRTGCEFHLFHQHHHWSAEGNGHAAAGSRFSAALLRKLRSLWGPQVSRLSALLPRRYCGRV